MLLIVAISVTLSSEVFNALHLHCLATALRGSSALVFTSRRRETDLSLGPLMAGVRFKQNFLLCW